MAKRFIDTEIFNDDWFMELSKDAKLFYIFYITNCDHAGILKLNLYNIKTIQTICLYIYKYILRMQQINK